MICEDIFQNLIEAIADAYGGFEVVTQAFKPIGERYHIGELKYRFRILHWSMPEAANRRKRFCIVMTER